MGDSPIRLYIMGNTGMLRANPATLADINNLIRLLSQLERLLGDFYLMVETLFSDSSVIDLFVVSRSDANFENFESTMGRLANILIRFNSINFSLNNLIRVSPDYFHLHGQALVNLNIRLDRLF